MRNANLTQSLLFCLLGSLACPYMFLIPGEPQRAPRAMCLPPYMQGVSRTPEPSPTLCVHRDQTESRERRALSQPQGWAEHRPCKDLSWIPLTLWKSPLALHGPFAVRASAA